MEINVYFFGVCTHVWWEQAPAFTKRVVLVNAIDDTPFPDKTVLSHLATLSIANADIIGTKGIILPEPVDGSITLNLNRTGVRMQIANTTGDPWRDGSFENCVPKLSELTPNVGPPSKAAVDDGRPDLVSCIFTVTGGRLMGGSNDKGAAFSLLTAETNGNPLLHITPFGSETPGEIELRDNAKITIANLGATEVHDDQWDFYLHYKLAETMPTVRGLPGPSPCRGNNAPDPTWPPGFKSVGPGCSNSAYP